MNQLFKKNISSNYGRTWVNISIGDINDNPPKFPVPNVKIYLPENSPIGHKVFLARAYDPDNGENSKIIYTLSNTPDDYFTISKESGMIYLNKPVKYGNGNSFNLEVIATDDGNEDDVTTHYISSLCEW